jgi:hypothetical protein
MAPHIVNHRLKWLLPCTCIISISCKRSNVSPEQHAPWMVETPDHREKVSNLPCSPDVIPPAESTAVTYDLAAII